VGTDGLSRCLTHIEATQAALVTAGIRRVRVFLKGSADQVLPNTLWAFSQDNFALEIVGGSGGVASNGRRSVITSGSQFPSLQFSGGASVILQGLHFEETGALRSRPLVVVEGDGTFEAENCYLGFDVSSTTWSGTYGLDVNSTGARMRNCTLASGYVRFIRRGSALTNGARIENCLFEACGLALNDGSGANGVAEGTIVQNCEFNLTSFDSASVSCLLDVRGASGVTVSGCKFAVFKKFVATILGGEGTSNIRVSNCEFETTIVGAEAPGAGQGSALGTGWAISFRGASGGDTDAVRPNGLHVTDCHFLMGGALPATTPMTDAGAIQFIDCHHATVKGCRFEGAAEDTVNAVFSYIEAQDRSNNQPDNATSLSVSDCTFYGSAIPSMTGVSWRNIRLQNVANVRITGCDFNASDANGSATISGIDVDSGAITLGTTYNVTISGCVFDGWPLISGDDGSAIRGIDAGNVNQVNVTGCTFNRCGGLSIDFSDSGNIQSVVVSGCTWGITSSGKAVDFEALTSENGCVFSGNSLTTSLGVGVSAVLVDFGAVQASSAHIFSGNIAIANSSGSTPQVRATSATTNVVGLSTTFPTTGSDTLNALTLLNRGWALVTV